MNISRQDAAEALASVESADRRMDTLRAYRDAAPFLQLWGAVWFIANGTTDFWRHQDAKVWLVATCIGLPRIRRNCRPACEVKRARGSLFARRSGTRIRLGFAMLGHHRSSRTSRPWLSYSGTLDARQTNAFISLFWALTYMAAGAWLGPRLFLTGAVAVLGIVAGYLYVHEHFALWMAFFAGGS